MRRPPAHGDGERVKFVEELCLLRCRIAGECALRQAGQCSVSRAAAAGIDQPVPFGDAALKPLLAGESLAWKLTEPA